jgi:hypothetical protein
MNARKSFRATPSRRSGCASDAPSGTCPGAVGSANMCRNTDESWNTFLGTLKSVLSTCA